MNNQTKIQLIETKIKETQSTLTHWTKNIETYHQLLQQLTNQLNQIKSQSKENKKIK